MRINDYLAKLGCLALLLGTPIQALAEDPDMRPMKSDSLAIHEKIPGLPSEGSTQQRSQAEPSEMARLGPVQMASVDYCYRGTITDPATGETVEVYVMCTEGEIGENLDIA